MSPSSSGLLEAVLGHQVSQLTYWVSWCDVESTSAMLIQRRRNVVCPVGKAFAFGRRCIRRTSQNSVLPNEFYCFLIFQ